jgi:cytochrome-b5 reductase
MSPQLIRRCLPLFPLAGVVAGGLYFNRGQQFSVLADASAPAGALDPNNFKAFKLIKKDQLTHNTFFFRVELPNNQVSGLFTASCVVFKTMMKDKPEDELPKPVVRPYTPVSSPDAKGYIDFVIKVYPTGKMGNYIKSLSIGDNIEIKGPIPKYPYQTNIKKRIGMVAGGTGIAPMLQVIDAILSNPADNTEISLVYGNVSESDILLKSRLDELAAKHPGQFKLYYVVDKASWGGFAWKGGVGYITKNMLKEKLPPPSMDNLIMVCGPPGLMAAISGGKAPDFSQGEVSGLLKDLGYSKDMVYKF